MTVVAMISRDTEKIWSWISEVQVVPVERAPRHFPFMQAEKSGALRFGGGNCKEMIARQARNKKVCSACSAYPIVRLRTSPKSGQGYLYDAVMSNLPTLDGADCLLLRMKPSECEVDCS